MRRIDQATNNLARALKRDTLKKNGRIDYDKLRKEGDSERFEVDAPVLVRRLAHGVRPESLGPHLQVPALGRGHLVVAHGDQWSPVADEVRPVPDGAEVRVQADAHVAAELSVGRGEVEVPGLVPQLVGGVGLVLAFVARVDRGHVASGA